MRRGRNRQKTREELRLAMLRLKNKGVRISIKAVAEEAGVDPSLVHNTYPDIAEEIRGIIGRSTRRQRDEKHGELMEARRLLQEVTAERDQLKREMADLASVNLTLIETVAELKIELAGKLTRMKSGSAAKDSRKV